MPKKVPVKVLSHVAVLNVIGEKGQAKIYLRGIPSIKSVIDLPGPSAFGIVSLSDEDDIGQNPVSVKWSKVSGAEAAIVLGDSELYTGTVNIDDPMAIARVPYLITIVK